MKAKTQESVLKELEKGMNKMDILETMPIIDRNEEEDAVLIRLENDMFDTVVLVYHFGEENEEVYVLDDMQGECPESFDEVQYFNWNRAEDIDW